MTYLHSCAGRPAKAPAPWSGFSAAGYPGAAPSQKGALGKYGKSVDRARRRATRLATYAAKRTAANLLHRHDEKWSRRVSACGYVAHAPSVELSRKAHANGDVSASLNGLVSCKSVWACPVCSARISGVRRDEMNALLAWARGEGHAVVMLTLTARHSLRTALGPFLGALKDAAKRLRQSKGWRKLPHVGSVTATEVTHGANGWHPHFHLLLVLDGASASSVDAVEGLRSEWLRCLGREGLNGNAAAYQVQPASAAGDYVAKFGAAEEIALGRSKTGREGSRSPWQLLADATSGDKRACALWVEYAVAFKGRRQLQWSPGLKAKAGIDEVSDDEAAEVDPVMLRAWPGRSDAWRSARRRRCALLDAAEAGGDLDRAEHGPTDAERWRGEVAAADVVDDENKPEPAARSSIPRPAPGPLAAAALDAHRLVRSRPSRGWDARHDRGAAQARPDPLAAGDP